MKILIDTNVIIDAMAGRPPWNEWAERIILQGAAAKLDLYITASMATDIFYISKRYVHNGEEVKRLMTGLFDLIEILPVRNSDCIDALNSKIKDYEDAVLESVAYNNGMDYIVTRNAKDFACSRARALDPMSFSEKFIEETITI